MNDWVYYGIFFSQQTKNYLIQKAKELVDIPEDWKLYGDHMTIVYNDGSKGNAEHSNALDEFLGKYQQLMISSIGISNEAIAFGVSNYKTQNKHSHITIAVAPGSTPVKSNEIKEWSYNLGFHVTGKLGKISKKK